MLSSKFKFVPLSFIHFSRETRQRSVIDISDIFESIKRRGVLVPICIKPDGELIFGERRVTAAQLAGHVEIPARIAKADLSPLDLQVLELEENLMREDLPWQDKAKAMAKLFELFRRDAPEATTTQFAESLGYSLREVQRYLLVADEITNERVANAPALQKAINVISRTREREENNLVADILDTISTGSEAPPLEVPSDDIITTSFHEWALSYTGPRFNFIHCDFPFGIGLDDSDQLQAGGTAHLTYDDSESVYWALLETLAATQDQLLSTSSHMIFWFAMEYYRETLAFFESRLATWTFEKYPLIWHKSDNKGIAPDVTRRPRRIYETAFFGWRGDRKLVKLASNSYPAPKEASAHPSTKPEPVLRHFFQMVVDGHTRLLDPTCGSGTALRAAESLGANRVLGLEFDMGFADDARAKLKRFRSMAKVAELVGGK